MPQMAHPTFLRCQRERRRQRPAQRECQPALERQRLERQVSATHRGSETIMFLPGLLRGVFIFQIFLYAFLPTAEHSADFF